VELETRYARSGEARLVYQVFGDGPIDLVAFGGPALHIDVLWEYPGMAHWYERTVFGADVDAYADEVEEFLTGTRPAREPDRVLTTVLFTDIVDSTARAAELGDSAWHRLLDDHDGIAREQVERERGRLVKGTGDGVLATFDGPARAIRAARAMQRAAGEIGVAVRAGVHTGEVELMGDDLGGIAVHIGARISSLAEGGEVLVSSTVRELVTGSQLQFADRGAHELKGVPGEWRVYALVG
jgi:class 3 adenylate cyclase